MSDDTEKGRRLAVLGLVAAALGLFPAGLVLAWSARRRTGSGRGYSAVLLAAVALSVFEALAFIAVAGLFLLQDPLPSRRRAALDQMRKIRKAQEEFRKDTVVDQDGDGEGEYGYLHELARGAVAGKGPETGGRPYVSGVFTRPEPAGYVEKYGYYFVVFLPGEDWRDAPRPPAENRRFQEKLAPSQERSWIAYAWPAVAGRTASGVLVADPTGIYAAENRVARFDGEHAMPAPHAALNGTGLESVVPEGGLPSLCGEVWTKVD